MNFNFSETQQMVAEAAKDFAEKYIRPHVMQWDESQEFPVEVFRKAGELGFMGILVPEIYGGSALDYHDYIAIVEEISKVDPSIGLSIAAHNSLCTNHILNKRLHAIYVRSSHGLLARSLSIYVGRRSTCDRL